MCRPTCVPASVVAPEPPHAWMHATVAEGVFMGVASGKFSKSGGGVTAVAMVVATVGGTCSGVKPSGMYSIVSEPVERATEVRSGVDGPKAVATDTTRARTTARNCMVDVIGTWYVV